MAVSSASFSRIPAGARLTHLFIILLLIETALGTRFDSIDKCRAQVIAANDTTPALNLTFELTLAQCYEYYGSRYGSYDTLAVISALSSWVIPLFLLLGNITYANISSPVFDIGKVKLGYMGNWIAAISHLLVNPLDFLWSLCLKLDRGYKINRRCDKIIILSPDEKKNLSDVTFSLDDYENGIHVNSLLQPLENKHVQNRDIRNKHHEALKGILGSAARDLADARKHNKLHSTLAILIYGKEVFEALIDAKLDGTFPYHMPHTLALRQLYYWLFLAVLISSAAGGFANQWTSLAILNRFLTERQKALQRLGVQDGDQSPIVLEPLKPWNGGNYSWRHCKGGVSMRGWFMFVLVIVAVAFPVMSAFLLSWITPTVGLGDRGIMELSFAGLWVVNYFLTLAASKWLRPESLFRIVWWNLFWSLASLIVLFAAFEGWFNSCMSWAAFFSRGYSGAVLNLNMKAIEEGDIFRLYLPIVIVALAVQLLLAGIILRLNKDILKCLVWSDGENRTFWECTSEQELLSVGGGYRSPQSFGQAPPNHTLAIVNAGDSTYEPLLRPLDT
ncbi:hypothetical protein MMC27_006273 [Xylographa pallens]|nr:hypothetical protein [Xylographa pallens]